ncbi:unnamed protein product [Prunus armeniaca]
MFAVKSLLDELFLTDELLNLQMEEVANMMEHISTFNRCITELQKMDEIYKMEDKAMMLLTSLPSSYKHFRTTLMFCKSTLNFEEVVQDILTYHRMTIRSGEGSQDEGLVEKAEGRGRSMWVKGSHLKKNCPTWKERRKKREEANNTAWENVGEVVIGTTKFVELKLQVLSRYMPKLRNNLISLDTFDKNDYSYKAIRGELIGLKGSLVIMKGEIQPNCLYRLCGTMVTGGAAIFTENDLEDDTKL